VQSQAASDKSPHSMAEVRAQCLSWTLRVLIGSEARLASVVPPNLEKQATTLNIQMIWRSRLRQRSSGDVMDKQSQRQRSAGDVMGKLLLRVCQC
jgi:hypothetical protein